MTRENVRTGLGWFVGIAYILFGAIEVIVRVASDDPLEVGVMTFFVVTLCGAGALVLIGSFVVPRPSWRSFAFVAVGCVFGTLLTIWTLLLPILAVTLVVLSSPPNREVDTAPAAEA